MVIGWEGIFGVISDCWLRLQKHPLHRTDSLLSMPMRAQVGAALKESLGEVARLSCRFTHVYPDGPAPYYSFSGVVTRGGEAEAWQHIKDTTTAAVIEAGGICTHHHAVGRMHRTGYDQQVPATFRTTLRAMKTNLDPNNVFSPGVLID